MNLRKMTKKLIAATLSATFLLTVGCLFASCAQSEELLYERIADTEYCRVIGIGTVKGKDVIIPSTYQGYTVKEIGDEAFYGNDNIESVVIPEEVTWIGNLAFKDCDNLKSVTMGDAVENIGQSAFHNCQRLRAIEIPESLTVIKTSTFAGCSSLTTITIPEGIEAISSNAFNFCYKLVEVVNESFYIADDLDKTDELEKVGYLGKYAIDVFNVGDAYTSNLSLEGDWLYYLDSTKILLDYFGGEKDLLLPQGTEEIYNYAFRNRTDLTSIYLSEEVIGVRDFAFVGCNNLRIYCQWSSRPLTWQPDWNVSECIVEWGVNM